MNKEEQIIIDLINQKRKLEKENRTLKKEIENQKDTKAYWHIKSDLKKEKLEELKQRIDKATGMLEFLVFNGERPLTINELNKLYYILKGSEDNE
jgi:hypothetical protein